MNLIQIQTQTSDTPSGLDPRALITTVPIMVLTAEHPELQPVLDKFGLDTCCGGHLTVVEASRELGVDPDAIANALVDALGAQGSA